MSAPLYIVHAIDTEGPLHESLEATFERVEKITGVRLEPSRATLKQIQNGELDLGGKEKVAAKAFSKTLLHYNDTWDKLDAMLFDIMSEDYRQRYADSQGNGWIYSWFVVDHVGYTDNPRRRDIGYHNIFDHYRSLMRETNSPQDDLQFHFHPMPTYREAHICATSYLRSPHLWETLARRIIDRTWFPSTFRPGFHAERPDAHWFLEQWLPFDYANQAMSEDAQLGHNDVAAGRLGDWRRAPQDWSHYQPHHDDYQTPGNCRRTIFRCLNVGTRFRLLDEAEVRKAFARSQSGEPTILAFTNHDFRDMRPDVESTHALIRKVAEDFPNVPWHHSRAKDAAQKVLRRTDASKFELTVTLTPRGERLVLDIRANHDSFGPQPFLAIKTKDKRYLTDNLDLQTPRRHWTYVFDADTVLPDSLDAVGVASNDLNGHTHVVTLRPDGSLLDEAYYG